jgi:hypothetical protein
VEIRRMHDLPLLLMASERVRVLATFGSLEAV